MNKLNESVRIVVMQFSFSNPAAIPASLRSRSPETADESQRRKNRSSGTLFIVPTEKCSISGFAEALEAAGYVMVDAFYQKRVDPHRQQKMYHTVRFVFGQLQNADSLDEFNESRGVLKAELQYICEQALWRVRAFSNPLYQMGEEVPGLRAWSINFEARQPLFLPNGQPVTVWPKDDLGRHIGDEPAPIRPDCRLELTDGRLVLV